MRSPLGDHDASVSSALEVVTCWSALPLTSTLKMSQFPLRIDWKRMRSPAGDQFGWRSSPLPVVSWARPVPSIFTFQIDPLLVPARLCDSKTIHCPSGENDGSQ